MSNEWISVKDKSHQPINKTWVEVKHSLFDEPLEHFYWDKYDWKDPHITHWRYILLPLRLLKIPRPQSKLLLCASCWPVIRLIQPLNHKKARSIERAFLCKRGCGAPVATFPAPHRAVVQARGDVGRDQVVLDGVGVDGGPAGS